MRKKATKKAPRRPAVITGNKLVIEFAGYRIVQTRGQREMEFVLEQLQRDALGEDNWVYVKTIKHSDDGSWIYALCGSLATLPKPLSLAVRYKIPKRFSS